MNTTKRGGFWVWAAAAMMAAGPANAQLVELTGAVTDVTGCYTGDIPVGSPIWVQLDLSAPLVDLVPEDPKLGVYRDRPMSFRCDGRAFPVEIWPNEVWIVNQGEGRMNGLIVGAVWSMDFPSTVVFGLVGDTDLITCDSFFPAGIPLDSLSYHEGEYFSSGGNIRWSIDAYFVSPDGHVGAPEPSTYGMVGAAGLLLLACGRRRARGRGGR